MAQSGRTSIITYNTATASALPSASNLTQGELAVNVTDKKLYTKNSGGAVVQVGSGPDATETLTNKTLTNPTYSGTTANGGSITTIDINGGTIDNTAIGSATQSTGAFSSLIVGTVSTPNTVQIIGNSSGTSGGAGVLIYSGANQVMSIGNYSHLTGTAYSNVGRIQCEYGLTIGKLAATWMTFNASTGAVTIPNALSITGTTTAGALVATTIDCKGNGAVTTNVVIGSGAVAVATTGTGTTAIGYNALASQTSGYSNTAIGATVLDNLTTGYQNVAIGTAVMDQNCVTVNNNTAVGFAAMRYATGNSNVAIGSLTLGGTSFSGTLNVAVGNSSLFSCSTGNSNTCIGSPAAVHLTTGVGNTAVGSSSYSSSNGNYNTIVGFNTGGGITGAANIAIGGSNSAGSGVPVFDISTNNNRISMGHTSITNAYIQVAWTVVSDARDKTDVKPVEPGLDFVMKLNPVSYRFKETRDAEQGHGPTRYGFLAQDVLALEGDRPVIVDAEDPNKLRFNEQALVAVLVRALQELKADFDAYKLAHA